MVSDLIVIVSLALTIPFVAHASVILRLWFPSVKEAYSVASFRDASSALARGVFSGFVSNILDNTYWGVTWALVLFQHPLGLAMMLGGSLANIFFRQLGGIYSAREHVVAAIERDPENRRWGWVLTAGWIGGLATFIALSIIKL